jgi:hypothetical protein
MACSNPVSRQCDSQSADHGAVSTCRHAAGISASVMGGFGLGGTGGGFGCSTASLNQ